MILIIDDHQSMNLCLYNLVNHQLERVCLDTLHNTFKPTSLEQRGESSFIRSWAQEDSKLEIKKRITLSRTIILSKFNYLPWNISDQDNSSSCTSSGPIMQLCKSSSVSIYSLRRRSVYKTFGQKDGWTDG